MKRIGILGGASDQATADYYRQLNAAVNARLGGLHTAELIISSMDFAFCADSVRNGRWDQVAEYLADRAQALERAGADLLICASNSLHQVHERFIAGLSIPFLHIADPTGLAIGEAGLGRVALLGTRATMSGDHLPRRLADRFGVATLVPTPEEQAVLDRIIFEELCRGVFTPEARAIFLAVIDRLQAEGAEGVILGCTEIPLLIDQRDRPALPMFDTTALHVQGALAMAFGE